MGSPGETSHEGDTLPAHIDEAALVRKIDMRVMPMLFAIYFVAFLDRYDNIHVAWCYN